MPGVSEPDGVYENHVLPGYMLRLPEIGGEILNAPRTDPVSIEVVNSTSIEDRFDETLPALFEG